MKQTASTSFKVVYFMVILTAIFPIGIASSGWVAMAKGGNAMFAIPYFGQLIILIIGLFRLYLVVKVAGTLDAYPVSGVAKVLRILGVGGLYFGAIVGMVNVFAAPLMRLLMTSHTESGAEYFFVGVILSFFTGVGTLGLISFELSRLIGFERQS